MTLASIPLVAIRESATNPRKTFDPAQLDELTASVRQFGVLQPVLVRPIGAVEPNEMGAFELIAGARRLRAAKAAGLVDIPAIVLELDDRQTLEVQVIENLQREDLGVLEEARGFQLLHREHGYDVEHLAAKVGKSTSYVYQRMQLVQLPPAALQLLEAGKLTAAQALLLVRIPNAERAEEAAYAIAEGHGGTVLSTQAARELIERDFMLELQTAPFDTAAADLLPSAGPCSTCPKRTGNQRTLFGEVDGADLCTDSACFAAKVAAAFDLVAAQAKKAGAAVVAKAKSWAYDFVKLSEKCWDDPKTRTYAKLLGGRRGVDGVEGRVLGQDQRGAPLWLFPRKELRKALRKAGHNFWARGEQKQPPAEARDTKAKRELEKAVRVAEREAVRNAIQRETNHDRLVELLRLVVTCHAGHYLSEDEEVCEVWGNSGVGAPSDFQPATRSFADLVAILVDLTFARSGSVDEEALAADFRQLVGVDLVEVEERVHKAMQLVADEQKAKKPTKAEQRAQAAEVKAAVAPAKRRKARKGKEAAAGQDSEP